MPTGYTEVIERGGSFREYLLRCARAFGACIMMRDEPLSVLPKETEPSSYHKDEIAKAKKRHAEICAMSVEEAEKAAEAEYQEALRKYQKYCQGHADTKKKYDEMKIEVERWTPPTGDHQELKKFMIQQIDLCNKGDTSWYTAPTRETGEAWWARKKSDCLNDIKYHEKEYEAEVKRVTERNQWIRQLYDSVKEGT